jgi:hypothetical protein
MKKGQIGTASYRLKVFQKLVLSKANTSKVFQKFMLLMVKGSVQWILRGVKTKIKWCALMDFTVAEFS